MTRRLLRDDTREIRDRGFGVQAGEHMVAARIAGELGNAGVPVVEIAEDDRLGRTGLRARRDDVTVAHVPILEARLILRTADTLHAERAFLHDALFPHRDVRVQQHRERLREGFVLPATLGVVVPVEVAHLVRAVVGAIARADTAVVDLAIEAVGGVIGGVHRADRLAWRVAALLAQHRLVHRTPGVAVLVGAPIPLPPHPRQYAGAFDP